MTHGSLFSGIGGFDLAARWCGWTNVFNCEIDPFCRQVLDKNFPEAIKYSDVRTTDFTIHRGTIDVLSGGFPCQPFSIAGKRKGTDDPRHLWPEYLRAIKEIQPGFVVGENVYGIVNWNKGLVFEQICADLEGEGYEVQPLILPACAKNANHRRDRVWFVAHANIGTEKSPGTSSESISYRSEDFNEQESGRKQAEFGDRCNNVLLDTSDTEQIRREKLELQGGQAEREMRRSLISAWDSHWRMWPIEPTLCGDNDGLPDRVDRVAALGNAIVPQIAYEIFKVINTLHNATNLNTCQQPR